ncbi:hypothetical protein ACHWQZ_G006134 [Mnemiopsis leidyi]
MSGPELQQELDQLVKQEEELVKNILKCREKLKNLDVAEQNAGKVKVFDLSAERDGLALEIEDLKKRIGERKQNHRKEEECEQTAPRVKLESTEDVCFDGSVSSRNVLFVQRDKGERYDDNGSMCKLKAPVYKLGDDFCTFLLRFEQYIMLSRMRDNLDFRLSSLIEDDAMFKKVRNIRLSAEERLDIGMLVEAVKRDMFPVTDARILRTTFHKMRQGRGENVEQYAQRVMDEAERIYPDRTEREGAAINVLISGVKDSEIKRKLFAGSVSEDFVGMTKLAIQEEHILEAIGMRSGSQMEPIAPMFCVRKKDENQGVVNCQKCGKRGHVAGSCWSEVVCQLCNRTGHVASVCWDLAASICQDDITASSSAQSEGVQPVVCFNCQEPGHIQRFCNRHQGGGNENQSSPSYDQQRTSQQDALKLANDWRNSGPIQSREIPEKRSEREKVADVNAVNWKHILVKGSCAGRDSYIFVDSGSAVSIVSTGFVKRLGLEKNIRKCRFTLKSFSQDIIQVRGEIDLELEVAGSKFNHTFIVTDLLDTEFLMGDDFLRRNWITLDYGQCRLLLPEGQGVSFTEKPENVEKQIKVRCSKVTVIPPNTVQYLKGKLQANGRSYQGVLEPQYKNGVGETGILFAKAVVHSDKKFVPVKCVNATDEPITIHKNKIVALLKPLGDHELIKGVQLATENECKVRGTGIDEPLPEQRPAAGDGRWTKLKLFESLGLDKIEVEMSDDEKERLKDIVWRYRNCFSYDEFDIGCCNMYEAEIKLKEGSSPSWTYPIPTPHKLQEEMDHQIDQMVKAGVAERLSEPSDFNHPIFLVKKKSSPGKPDSWRLVADLRGTNKVCMDEKYPLPNLNHVLDTIGSDTIFSSFDLSKSFWQVPYSEDSKKITAFMHRGRSYCWARLIMGHKNSSSIFSRVMAKLLATVPIEQLIFFIDDLFLSSRTVSSHLDRLEILLRRLLQANLKLTPKKCELLKKKVTFVGVSVSADGIQITEDRVKDLLDLPVPTTMKRVQEVLGALNYVRKWIPNYSELARPLHGLTVKGVKFLWTEGCQQAFDKLKRAIADSTILALPDTDDPCKSYHVTVDASKHGYGATLSQEIERNGTRERRIVAFFSKAVPPYKRERSQTQLEFDAMVLAIEHWKIYLSNTEFKVITDCKSLLSASDTLFSKSDPALIRKCQILANYNFSLEHVEGKRNTLCDFLSRFPFRRKLVDTGCQTVNSVRSQGEGTVRSRDISTSADLENDDRVVYTCKSETTANRNVNSNDNSPCLLQGGSDSMKTSFNRVVYTCDAEKIEHSQVKHPSLCDLHSDSNSKETCPTRVLYTCDGAKTCSCIHDNVKHPSLCDLHSDSNSNLTCPTRVLYTCDRAKSYTDDEVKHPSLCDLHSDSNSKVTCPTRVLYTCDGAKSCIDTKVKHPSLCDLHSDSSSKMTCPSRVLYTCDGAKSCSCIHNNVKHPSLCDLHSDSNSKVSCPTRVLYTCDGAKSCIYTKDKHPSLCDLQSDSNSKVTCPTRVIYTCDGAKSCIYTKDKHPSLCDLHSDSYSKVTCPTRVLYTCDCAKSHNEVNVKHCRPCHLQGDNSVNLTCPTRVLYTSDSFESCHDKKVTYNKLCHPHSDYNSKMTCPTRVVYTCDSVLSDIEEQASEQSCERSSDTGDKERTGKIRKGTPSQVVDSAEEMDTDERSDLQILFEENHSGLVKVVQVEESDDSLCICGVAVMPRLRKKQGKRITFAVTSEESNSQNLPDLDRIKEEQEKDPIISVVKKWVTEGDRGKVQTNRVPRKLLTYWTQFNLLKLDDGLLKRKWIRKKEQDCKDLIVVPESCEEEIMKLFHDNITNCHPGINTCVTKCREYFYWPKMEEDFRMYIKACVRCGEMKQPRAYLKAPLKHLFFHHFNDAIVVDHIVPSANQRTPRGFRYILTITDAWSNYLVTVPVRSQTAKENIAAIMKYWVLKFGLCREIIVDNHPGFTAGFFEEVWKAFECKKTHGTSYKSASTARAENNNKRVNQALRACLPHGKEHCWDVYLDKVTFALNCLKNRRTGFSAHKMVFGREVNLPLNLVLDDSKPHVPDERNTAAREAYDLHKEMKRVIRKVRENSEIDFSYAQKQYDRNIHGPYFKKGDYCFVLIQCPTHKFAPRFRGPFEVKKVINDHLYVVEFGPGVEKVTNISKMKHYEVNRFSKRKVGVTQNVDDVVQKKVDLSERDDRGESSSSDSSSDEEWYYPQQVPNLSNGGNKTRMSRNVIDIDSPRASRSVPALQNDFEPVASPHTPSLVSQSRPESANSQLFPRSPGANYVRTPLDSSSGQNTRSFDSSVDFYTPRRDIRESEPTRNMEDSLSPVSLSGTSNVTMTQSPSDHSTPRMYGGRNLRNREQLRRPDYYQATHCIYNYNESEVGQDVWV